jgi:HAD superfamily hydrolase (TIGR01509 family)
MGDYKGEQRSLLHPMGTVEFLMIRAVVFDLDGLMFDTEALFFRVSSQALAVRGKTFTSEIMQAMIGRRAAEVSHVLKTLAGIDEPIEALLGEIRERFYAEMDTAVHPTQGLIALLDQLRRRSLPLAVATSSRHAYVDRLLARHRLADRFDFVLASEDVTRGKPDPEIYERAAGRFGIPAGSMMVLEDSPAGVAAAHAAGAVVVAVPHEHSPAHALGPAHLVVPRLDDPAVINLLGPVNGERGADASTP